jgi:transcriptional regulator with XRE-family HTH domain
MFLARKTRYFFALDRNEALGEVIRKLRKELGLSQEALAERADMHWTYVSMVERCRCNPSVGSLFRLADALERDASDLLKMVEMHADRAKVRRNSPNKDPG